MGHLRVTTAEIRQPRSASEEIERRRASLAKVRKLRALAQAAVAEAMGTPVAISGVGPFGADRTTRRSGEVNLKRMSNPADPRRRQNIRTGPPRPTAAITSE